MNPELLEKLTELLPKKRWSVYPSDELVEKEPVDVISRTEAITALPAIVEAYNEWLVGKVEKLRLDPTLMNSYNTKRAGWRNKALDDIITLITNQNKV